MWRCESMPGVCDPEREGLRKLQQRREGRGGPWLWGMVVGGTLDEADACVSYGKRLPRLAATRVNYSGQTAADRCGLTHSDAGRSRRPRASLRHDPSFANHPLESSFFSSFFTLFYFYSPFALFNVSFFVAVRFPALKPSST